MVSLDSARYWVAIKDTYARHWLPGRGSTPPTARSTRVWPRGTRPHRSASTLDQQETDTAPSTGSVAPGAAHNKPACPTKTPTHTCARSTAPSSECVYGLANLKRAPSQLPGRRMPQPPEPDRMRGRPCRQLKTGKAGRRTERVEEICVDSPGCGTCHRKVSSYRTERGRKDLWLDNKSGQYQLCVSAKNIQNRFLSGTSGLQDLNTIVTEPLKSETTGHVY